MANGLILNNVSAHNSDLIGQLVVGRSAHVDEDMPI